MPISLKTSLLSLIFIAFLAGSTVAMSQLEGDLDGNYRVDSEDLRILARQWLNQICLVSVCVADLDGVDGVNMADFSLLARNWQIEAPHIIITEFMASNNSNKPPDPPKEGDLLDFEGDSSDWIEIYNPTDITVNLDGWHLTDSDANLTKWQFPAVELDPGKFLVVFASEKDLLDPNELHTNFELNKEGDYLALVEAESNAVVHEYTPEYPLQLTDISYGLAQDATVLVPTGATASYYVPTSGDASLGTDWTDVGFNDSSWEAGPTSIGFSDVGGAVGTIKREYWTGIDGPSVSDLTNNSNYPDNPSGSSEPTLFEAPLDWADDYGTRMHGFLYPPANGDYTFWIASDDASELWLSTDDNPDNVVLIASIAGWCQSRDWDNQTGTDNPNQQSASISLTGGQRYYIKALQ
ncbi:MAG: lamin tail domain-containing protein, partial [Planctomycetota bacterium]